MGAEDAVKYSRACTESVELRDVRCHDLAKRIGPWIGPTTEPPAESWLASKKAPPIILIS